MTFGFVMLLITQILLVVGTVILVYSLWSAARDVQSFIRGEASATDIRRPVVSTFKSWMVHLQSSSGLWFAKMSKFSRGAMASFRAKGLTEVQAMRLNQWLTKTSSGQLNKLLEVSLRDNLFAKNLKLGRWYRLSIAASSWLIFQLVTLVILVFNHVNLLTEILMGISVIGEIVLMVRAMSVNDAVTFKGHDLSQADQNKLVLQFSEWPEELQAVYSNLLWKSVLVHNMPLDKTTCLNTKISLLAFLMLKLTEFEDQETALRDFLTVLQLHLGDGDLLGKMQVLNEFWLEKKLDYQDLDPSLKMQIDDSLTDLNASLDQTIIQLVAVVISAEDLAKQHFLLTADKDKMSSEELSLYYERKLNQQRKLHEMENNANIL